MTTESLAVVKLTVIASQADNDAQVASYDFMAAAGILSRHIEPTPIASLH